MGTHRLKRNFTGGELSDILLGQIENDRYKYGCRRLKNMIVRPQGPVSRREGFQFIYDLTSLIGTYGMAVKPRIIPFEYDKDNAYSLVFFYSTNTSVTTTRVVFATGTGLVEDPTSPGDPYIYEFTGTFELEKMVCKQSADILFIVQPNRVPIEFKRLDHDEWSANEISFTSMPSDWNATDGYPQFVDFYEQRMVFASTLERPQTVWFSKSGDFFNFGVSSPIVASDAVTLTMDSGTQNKIRWTNTTKQLLLGTLGDEWSIAGSGYEPLSFSSNRTSRHTNVGSEKINALMINNVTLFIEKHGRRVNQFVFDFNSDTYDTVDLSVLAPHMTDNNSIISWAYQQSPYGIVWCIRDDGAMIALTFKREHKVAGWHFHETDGKFLTVGCTPGSREDDIWVVVERTIDDNVVWYIEKKAPEYKSDSILDAYFLDSHIVYDGASATTITGLEHLEGETVSILANGGVMADRVVELGAITLDYAVEKAVIGFKYESILEPTLLDINMIDGTRIGRVQRITKVDAYIYKSILFEYGRYDDSGNTIVTEELPFMYPSNITGQQIPLFTGNKEFDFPEGYDPETRLLVRQIKPLPLTVIMLTDTVETYG